MVAISSEYTLFFYYACMNFATGKIYYRSQLRTFLIYTDSHGKMLEDKMLENVIMPSKTDTRRK